MESHYVMQNGFAGHDLLKTSSGYSNQTKLSKRDAKLSFTDSTHFSEEFLKILKNPFAMLSILPRITISRIEDSNTIFSFTQKVYKNRLFVCEDFIEKFSDRAENFLGT